MGTNTNLQKTTQTEHLDARYQNCFQETRSVLAQISTTAAAVVDFRW